MNSKETNNRSSPNPAPTPEAWPKDMSDAAFYGVVGELVKLIEPNTEADCHGILLDTLVSVGNAAGRGAYFEVEANRHHPNLFGVLVGETAKARKGTSLGYTTKIREAMDADWAKRSVQSGLSTAEGLIKALEMIHVNGCDIPTILLTEEEFSSVLRTMSRHGNTLGTTLRHAWDGTAFQIMTKGTPQYVAAGHVSIIAHTTYEDLQCYLTKVDIFNGFANRFLWCCVRRRRLLPFGGQVPQKDFLRLMTQLQNAVRFARDAGEIRFAKQSRDLWVSEYPHLTQEIPGLVGTVVSRAEAQVRRLALIYALLDQSQDVKTNHLRAALEVWRYCSDSAAFIFAGRKSSGTSLKQRILTLLAGSAAGMTRTEISGSFNNHYEGDSLREALLMLQQEGLVNSRKEQTRGRAAERWSAIS